MSRKRFFHANGGSEKKSDKGHIKRLSAGVSPDKDNNVKNNFGAGHNNNSYGASATHNPTLLESLV